MEVYTTGNDGDDNVFYTLLLSVVWRQYELQDADGGESLGLLLIISYSGQY